MRGVQCQLESRRPRVKVQPVMACVYTQLCQEPWRSTPPLDTQSANGRATAHQIMHPPYWQCQLTRLCAQTKNKRASERASGQHTWERVQGPTVCAWRHITTLSSKSGGAVIQLQRRGGGGERCISNEGSATHQQPATLLAIGTQPARSPRLSQPHLVGATS